MSERMRSLSDNIIYIILIICFFFIRNVLIFCIHSTIVRLNTWLCSYFHMAGSAAGSRLYLPSSCERSIVDTAEQIWLEVPVSSGNCNTDWFYISPNIYCAWYHTITHGLLGQSKICGRLGQCDIVFLYLQDHTKLYFIQLCNTYWMDNSKHFKITHITDVLLRLNRGQCFLLIIFHISHGFSFLC